MNMNLYVIVLPNVLNKEKMNFFIIMNIKIKLKIFSHDELKLNLELRS